MTELEGKVAVITGGASGIGAALHKALTHAGVQTALWDLGFSGKITADGLQVECDVTDEDSVRQALDRTCAELGAPDFLINCAGIIDGGLLVSDKGPASLERFQKVISVNLIGSFNTMRLVAQKMSGKSPYNEDGERGCIVHLSSIAAFEGQVGQVAYAASKGGIVSMTLPAARDLARYGIRVNSVAPGVVDTPMMANMPEKIQEHLKDAIVFPQRYARPEDISGLVSHILQNPMINGEVIRIDGAMRMPAK